MLDLGVKLGVGLLPVLLFLGALIYLDSYKLVRFRLVAAVIGLGAVAAGISYAVNLALIPASGLSLTAFSRYVAPVVEELAKAAVVVALIRTSRVGFLVDAAILGFGTGAGFALVENLYYLSSLPDSHMVVWIVRGLGTAIMHGGTAVIFAVLSKALFDRRPGHAAFLPGLVLAMGVHSAFNHLLVSPIILTAGLLLALPLLVVAVFVRSEAALRAWLDVGFDADARLIELIQSGEFSDSRIGRYLMALRERFRGDVVVDLLCYLRLHTELSLRAKGLLMMREAGLPVKLEADIREKLAELDYLEKSIGRTGKLALAPFLRTSGKELWQITMLKG